MGKMKRIGIDSMILIYLLEGTSPFIPSIQKTLNDADEIFLSSLGLAEILTGFEKQKDETGKLQFLTFIQNTPKLHIPMFGKQETLIFAELRAKYPWLKAPDAIHLSTALSGRLDAFVSNDKALKKIKEISVLLPESA